MTEQIKSTIEEFKQWINRAEDFNPNVQSEHVKAMKLAIRSLKAWEEVLQEFEMMAKEYSNKMEDARDERDKDFFEGQSLAYFDAQAFINQKLAEMEEK